MYFSRVALHGNYYDTSLQLWSVTHDWVFFFFTHVWEEALYVPSSSPGRCWRPVTASSPRDRYAHSFLRSRPCPVSARENNWRGLLSWKVGPYLRVTEDVWRAAELWRRLLCLMVSGASEALHHKISVKNIWPRLTIYSTGPAVDCCASPRLSEERGCITACGCLAGEDRCVIGCVVLRLCQAEWWPVFVCQLLKKENCTSKQVTHWSWTPQEIFLIWMLHCMCTTNSNPNPNL